MLNFKRILVPIDFSAGSDLALNWAIMVARENTGSFIGLCHVLAMLAPVGPEPIAFDYGVCLEKEKTATEEKLRQFQKRIPPEITSELILKYGNAAPMIENICKDQHIDLVIMATHGRRGLSHLVFGSRAEETVRLAPCPVLVLHLNQAAEAAAQPAGAGPGLNRTEAA